MSEKTAQSPPTGEEAVALPDSLAAAFQDRIGSLAERMPEHAALLSEAGVRAQSYAGGLGESAAHKVEDVASRFHISAEDSLGKRYSDPAPAAEIERVAGFFRKNHHLNPQGATFQRVRKSVTRFVADDRSKKIEAAKEKIEGLNGSPLVGISDEGKEVFASEVEDEYWQQAGGLLAKLETIAGTDVASARDKGVILSGVAIRRKMGPLHKYMTTNDRHRQFDSALRSIIMTELPRAARDIDDSLTVDRIRQRFPHINPDSSFWQDRIQSVITRL
ncbi:MAG TPA: hypothetical protein VHB72_01775, partial [Candidatus Saccharimonadales bacterium]|nr:hypothetical protein [Candidatus Saccharimonadales bacterium]